MNRLKSIGIVIAIICFLLLTPSVFAWLAKNARKAENIVDHKDNPLVSAYVSIDSLSYVSGNGSVALSGTFYVYNLDPDSSISYDGEIRLEIFDLDGNTYLPHVEEEVDGNLEENDGDVTWFDVIDSVSESLTLHLDCLSPVGDAEPIVANEWYNASADIALRVNGGRNNESWTIAYSTEVKHVPDTDVEQLEGIGPTKDGETFSDDCTVNSNDDDERTNWQSLIYTDFPYQAVYWYVKAPGDSYGSQVDVSWGTVKPESQRWPPASLTMSMIRMSQQISQPFGMKSWRMFIRLMGCIGNPTLSGCKTQTDKSMKCLLL